MNLAANGMTVLALVGAAFPIYHLYRNRAAPGAVYMLALCIAFVMYPFNLILLEGEAAVLLRFSVVSLVSPLYFLALFTYLRYSPVYWQHVKLGILVYMCAAVLAPWVCGDLFIDFAKHQPNADIKQYAYEHGPVVWVMKLCSYGFVAIAGGAVLHRFNSSRSNGVHLLSLVIFPLLTALIDLLAVLVGFSTYHGVTAMQVSGTVSLFVLSYALIRHQLLVRVPVSRNALMSYLREGICVVSEHGEIADCNEALATMLGSSTKSLSGKLAKEVLPREILEQLEAHRRLEVVRDVEVALNNNTLYLSVSASLLEDKVTTLFSATDITERKLLLVDVAATAGKLRDVNERLEEISLSDPLTGLGNRRKLQNALSEIQQDQQQDHQEGKSQSAMGLIMVDIDHFKAINDTHGHDAGDLVLVALANAMRDNSRERDTVVRWGGEEFVVLACQTDARRLQVAAERLRLHIRQLVVELPNGVALQVTASIGASMVRTGQTPESALRDVDRLMYDAKQDGRDCVKFNRRVA